MFNYTEFVLLNKHGEEVGGLLVPNRIAEQVAPSLEAEGYIQKGKNHG